MRQQFTDSGIASIGFMQVKDNIGLSRTDALNDGMQRRNMNIDTGNTIMFRAAVPNYVM